MEFWTRKFRVVMGTVLDFGSLSFFLSFFQTLAQACDVRWGVGVLLFALGGRSSKVLG